MNPTPNQWLKFGLGWSLVFAVRLLPWRPPNVEPVTATLLPFSRTFGALGGAVFGFLSIFLYDAVTAGIGEWTFVVGTSYAVLAVLAHYYFRSRKGSPVQYATFAVVSTLVFDAVTGVLYGPLRFGGSFTQAFVGQIPFTLNHLLGNLVLGFVLSPLLQRWLTENPRLEISALTRTA